MTFFFFLAHINHPLSCHGAAGQPYTPLVVGVLTVIKHFLMDQTKEKSMDILFLFNVLLTACISCNVVVLSFCFYLHIFKQIPSQELIHFSLKNFFLMPNHN